MYQKKFYITTPIYYPSGKPHIGHAYSTIFADVIARYKALIGYDAFMLTGMDEHGQKIEEAATKNGLKPKQYVDKVSKVFLKLWKDLDIDYGGFIRTSSAKHTKVVQKVFAQFQQDDYIYLGEWSGLYCVSCEENYTKAQAIETTDGQLKCRVGHNLSTKKEPSYFFKMSQFHAWIKQLYLDEPDFIVPSARVNELTQSFLSEQLTDLSVSRTSINWGVPVLGDKKHKVYVWIDALLNYLTALGYMQSDDSLFQKYWNDPLSEVVHVMSKEITRFHCIYWPIMLHCLKLRQPTKVISHGWIITDVGKMSKSIGNVIDPNDYIRDYGSDALRYFLMKEMNIERDGVFSDKLFLECYNADLANTYGNLVSRFLGMLSKYNKGIITKGNISFSTQDNYLLNQARELITATADCINLYKIDELVHNILNFAKAANKYVEDTKPWALTKDNKKDELNNFLFCLANAIRVIACLLAPVLTKGVKKITTQMKFNKDQLVFNNLTNFDLLENHKVGASKAIYERK